MDRDILAKLLEVIDAKIANAMSRDSSDGGLTEHIREMDLVKELEDMCKATEGLES